MGWERWRRVPEPGACDFCLMLATRGAVYASQETAGRDNDYHAHCHCDQESEGNFDARTDVRITPEDASRTVDFRHSSGRDYTYDLSTFRNLGITDPPLAPIFPLGRASLPVIEERIAELTAALDIAAGQPGRLARRRALRIASEIAALEERAA